MGNIIPVNSYPALSLLISSLAYILVMGGRFLTSGGSEPPPGSPPRGLILSLAVLLLMVSIAIVLVTVFVFCCRRRRNRTGSESEHTVHSQLPGDRCAGDPFPVETALPAFPFAPEDGERGGSSAHECAVCLGAVEEGEMVRQLPACKHLYHVVCIDQWLAARRTCPVCRSQLDLWFVGFDPQAPVLDADDAHAPDQPPV